MSEEERNYYDSQEVLELVRKFEEMNASGQSFFFDLDEFETIIEYYAEQGDFEAGSKVVQYASDLFPHSTVLMLREAQIMAGKGHVRHALPRLKNLLAFEPQNEEILLTLASVYGQMRDHSQAIYYYREALRFADDQLADDICIDLALEHENMNDFPGAIRILKDALARNPNNETAIHELAFCFEMTGDIEACIHYYREFIDRFPYSYTSWYNLGNALVKTDQVEEAIDAFGYCLAIEPGFTAASFNRAMAFIHQEKFENAIDDLNEALQSEAPQASTYCYIGECYEKMGNFDSARENYLEALKLDDTFSEAYIGLGVLKDLDNHPLEALEYFRKALALDPENSDYLFLIAETLHAAGKKEEARETYDHLLATEPQSEDIWLEYSDFIAAEDGIDEALALLEKGLQELNGNISMLFRKVAYLHRLGLRQESYILLHALLPEYPELRSELTDYYPDIQMDPTFVGLCELYEK